VIKRFRDIADSVCFVADGAANVAADVLDWFFRKGLARHSLLGIVMLVPGLICAAVSGVAAVLIGTCLELTFTRIRPF
jgi:hypothetical protein